MAPELPDHLHGTFASAGNPIFSVDVDPSGKRLVTCGQDNKIKIWSTSPILSDQAEAQGEAIFPRLLATLTDHLGAVNVARFAPLGLDARPYLGSSIAKAATIHASSPPLLASGADDKLICIYELKPGPGRAAFGTKDTPNLENWKQVALMRGHDANVTDLSWSPDARSIASSSLDNLVIIWEVRTGQRLHTLSQHHGYVKGVAWDPFNSYLATQGELDGVYIWRLDQLDKPIAHITTMLTDSPSAGFHSRLSWSPDGQTLAATNGYSAPSHVSVLIKRKDWSAELNLAGHKGPVVVARHNPRFVHPQRESRPSELTNIVALGSTDRKFTIWAYGDLKPKTVGKNFFTGTTMDIAWSPTGTELFIASYDGSIACCTFEPGEIGEVATDMEAQTLIDKLFAGNTMGVSSLAPALTTSFDIARLRDLPLPPAPAPGAPSVLKAPMRRITLIPNQPQGGDVASTSAPPPPALPPAPSLPTSSSLGVQGEGPERRRAVPVPLSGPDAAPPPAPPAPPPPSGLTGKKRVAPTPLNPAPVPTPPNPNAHTQPPSHPSYPSVGLPSLIPPPPLLPHLSESTSLPSSQGGGLITLRADNTLLPLSAAQASKMDPKMAPGLRPGSPLMTGGSCELRCFIGGKEVWSDKLEKCGVVNLCASPSFFALTTTEGKWITRTTNANSVSYCICCVDDDINGDLNHAGELIVYSHGGRRVLPAIPLGSLAAFIATDCRPPPPPVPSSLALRVGGSSSSHPPPNNNSNSNTEGEARGKKLLVATLDGRIRVWDLNEGLMVIDATTSDLNPEAAASSGGLGTSVAVAKISSQGLPLIIMSNGGAFCYQPRMKVWMKVWDIQAPLLPHAASPLLPFTLSSNQGDLSTIQTEAQKHQGPVPHSQLMAQASASNAVALMLQRQERISLETNIASSLALGSSYEYKRWLLVYVRRLSADGDDGRLREVLEGLIDPRDPLVSSSLGAGGDRDRILGHHRASLFQEMIREALRNKSSQPIQDLAQELMDVHADIMGGGVSWGGLGRQEEGSSRGTKRQAEP